MSTLPSRTIIPPFLMPVASLAVAVLGEHGEVHEANTGFEQVIRRLHEGPPHSRIAHLFLNPELETLIARSADPEGVVFRGILNLGRLDQESFSLNATVYRRGEVLLLVAEKPVAEQERLSRTLMALNEQMGRTQRELVDTTRALKRKEAEIETLMLTDPLTQLPNRRAFDERFARDIHYARRHHRHLCLAVADVDWFKTVNDRFGHTMGDELLRRLAALLQGNLRQSDFVARWGGEEFTFLLHECGAKEGESLFNRLRERARRQIRLPDDSPLSLSIGVTELLADDSAATALKRADAALYRAKEGGRDRVVVLPER